MMSLIKKVRIYGLRTFVQYAFNEIKGRVFRYLNKTYSQNGEDLVIDRLLKKKKKGFYVDVGAYDPVRFSNTKRFYDKGWRGINIEPDTGNYRKFIKARKRDINLNIGINSKNGKITFYEFFPDTLSTFSAESAKNYIKLGYNLLSKKTIKVYLLSKILKEKCRGREIDFLSIDTEGFDLKVLQSNNWKNFSPKVICVESGPHRNIMNKKDIQVNNFLLSKGYIQKFKNNVNTIYFLEIKYGL